jgi:hypothetical protein
MFGELPKELTVDLWTGLVRVNREVGSERLGKRSRGEGG